MINNNIKKILIIGYGDIALRHHKILSKIIKKVEIKFLRHRKVIIKKKNLLKEINQLIGLIKTQIKLRISIQKRKILLENLSNSKLLKLL